MKISVFYSHVLSASEQTKLPVAEVLERVRAYGIHAVELDYEEFKAGGDELQTRLKQAGLSVASLYGFFDFENDPSSEPGLAFINAAAELGAGKVLVIPGFIDEPAGAERDRALHHMVTALSEMCDYAEQKKIVVTLEDFDDIRAPFSSSDELLWFLERVPQLRCTFDTGNFKYRGEDELEAFEKLKGKIVHVHCKDRSLTERAGENPKLSTDGTRLFSSPVGSGCIPLEELLNRLRLLSYDDTLAIEHFDALDQLGYMEQSAGWLLQRV